MRVALTFSMSLQVFLQAQLLGATKFLTAEPELQANSDTETVNSTEQTNYEAALTGRCAWLNLFCEVLPRALLSELRLSRMLLGSASAEQFLLVLAEEDVPRANELLHRVAQALRELSGDMLQLIWAATENLGAWPVARKRLDDALQAKTSTPLAGNGDAAQFFEPVQESARAFAHDYFASFAAKLATATRIGWSSDQPAHLTWDEGQYTWALNEQSGFDDEGILFPRRFAPDDAGTPASPAKWPCVPMVRHDGAPLRRCRSVRRAIEIGW